MHISSWAAMTKRHRGRQWHCRTIRTFKLDYASPPQATEWLGGRSKRTGQWLGCGNSIPRYVFPHSKTCGALIGVLKTSRDWKKDCGKPGCPNDITASVLPWRRGSNDFRLWPVADMMGRPAHDRFQGHSGRGAGQGRLLLWTQCRHPRTLDHVPKGT